MRAQTGLGDLEKYCLRLEANIEIEGVARSFRTRRQILRGRAPIAGRRGKRVKPARARSKYREDDNRSGR